MKYNDINLFFPISYIEKILKFTKGHNFIVFTDSGHGWETPGKRSADETLRENEFNSAVEDRITLLLNYLNIRTVSLAPEWNDVPLNVRTVREREAYRKYNFKRSEVAGISIHANAYTTSDPNDLRTYYYPNSDFGELLSDIILIEYGALNNKYKFGIKAGNAAFARNFHMLRETLSPFCLIECGFMTNPSNLAKLKSDDFRNAVAITIVRSIIAYFKNINK